MQHLLGAGDRTGMGVQLIGKLAFVTARIQQANKACLAAWLRELPLDQFASRCVRPVQYYLGSLAQRQVSPIIEHGNNQCPCHNNPILEPGLCCEQDQQCS